MIQKWIKCFSSEEEFLSIINHISNLSDEIYTLQKEMLDISNGKSEVLNRAFNQIFLICLFYRDHIELINELMKTLEFKELSDEIINKSSDGN